MDACSKLRRVSKCRSYVLDILAVYSRLSHSQTQNVRSAGNSRLIQNLIIASGGMTRYVPALCLVQSVLRSTKCYVGSTLDRGNTTARKTLEGHSKRILPRSIKEHHKEQACQSSQISKLKLNVFLDTLCSCDDTRIMASLSLAVPAPHLK